jgi:hypothetical protein
MDDSICSFEVLILKMKSIAILLIISSLIALPIVSSAKSVDVSAAFSPSGWMGDFEDITFDDSWVNNTHSGDTCIQITYSVKDTNDKGWAGIYWQFPEKNWGDVPEGRNLTGAKNLTFWARGMKGGEKAEFKVGGITGQYYPDSIQIPVSTGIVVLSKNWTKYVIDLSDEDLSHVVGGFCWVTSASQNPVGCTIYLDDIKYLW